MFRLNGEFSLWVVASNCKLGMDKENCYHCLYVAFVYQRAFSYEEEMHVSPCSSSQPCERWCSHQSQANHLGERGKLIWAAHISLEWSTVYTVYLQYNCHLRRCWLTLVTWPCLIRWVLFPMKIHLHMFLYRLRTSWRCSLWYNCTKSGTICVPTCWKSPSQTV